METITLKNVFLQSQEKLKASLLGLKLPRDYVELQKKVNTHIETLLVSDNEFRNSLTVSDAEVLGLALKMSLSFQKLTLIDCIDFKPLSFQSEFNVEKNPKGESSIVENTLSLLPTVICAFINPWLAMVAGLGTIGVKTIYCKNGSKDAFNIKETRKDISWEITKEEIQTILSGIETLCTDIDNIIIKIQRERKELLNNLNSRLDDYVIEKMYPQILRSLQYIFMEDINNQAKNQNIQNLRFSLQGYGYDVVEYSPSNISFFIKMINPNVSNETMYLPAIVKEINNEKVVVAQGIVYIPKK